MLYILHGEDSYSRHQALIGIKESLGNQDVVYNNTSILSGAQLTPTQLINIASTAPFLAPQRLVIVEGLMGRFEPRRTGLETSLVTTFEDAIRQSAPTTILVLVDDRVAPSNHLFQALSPLATVRSFPPLRGEKLQGWIRETVARRGGAITPAALRSLAELVGNDLWALSQEIDKLLLFSQGQPVQVSHVQQAVAAALEADIFRLVDALLQHRTAQASRLMHRLLRRGMAPPQLVALLARQLRFLVLAIEYREQKLTEKEMQGRLRLPDFALRRTLEQSRQYSLPRLIWAYQQLADTDLAIKTGRMEDRLALDILVAELGSAKPA